VYGKALGKLIRICGIIKIVNMICAMVENISDTVLNDRDALSEFFEQQNIDILINKVKYEVLINLIS
jgi:hypothetical protein